MGTRNTHSFLFLRGEQRAKKTQDQMKGLVELRSQLQVHFAAFKLPALSGLKWKIPSIEGQLPRDAAFMLFAYIATTGAMCLREHHEITIPSVLQVLGPGGPRNMDTMRLIRMIVRTIGTSVE